MEQDFNVFLSELISVCKTNTYEAYLPHAKKTINFKKLNTLQFNKIISSLVAESKTPKRSLVDDSVITALQDNLLEEALDIKELSVIDKYFLFLSTKQHCVSDSTLLYFTEDEVEKYDLRDNSTPFLISSFFELKQHIKIPETVVIKADNIIVECNIPIVKTERSLEHYTSKITELVANDDVAIIEAYFAKELLTYISSVELSSNKVSIDQHSIESMALLVQQLPATLTNDVIKAIEVFKQHVTELLTVPVNTLNRSGSTITIPKLLPVNGLLFTS